MKINLSDDLTDDLIEFRVVGGYGSIQDALKMMVRLYAEDWKSRFSATPPPSRGTQQANITQITNNTAVSQLTTDTQPQENPQPEW